MAVYYPEFVLAEILISRINCENDIVTVMVFLDRILCANLVDVDKRSGVSLQEKNQDNRLLEKAA